jgi:hypothetical protein
MYLLKRSKHGGSFNIKPNKFGGFQRLMRNKSEGYGIGKEMYDNAQNGSKTPIQHLTQKMEHLKIRSGKPRKYISLNL